MTFHFAVFGDFQATFTSVLTHQKLVRLCSQNNFDIHIPLRVFVKVGYHTITTRGFSHSNGFDHLGITLPLTNERLAFVFTSS